MELIAISQDVMGKPARLVGGARNVKQLLQVYVRQLANGDYAAALFNRQDSITSNITLHWGDMDMPPLQPLVLRDMWKHEDLGTFSSNFTAFVPPRSVIALK